MFSVGWWNCLRRIKRHCVKPCPNSFSILLLRISRQSWDVGKGIDVFKVLLSDLMSKAILPASNLIEKSCQKHLTKMVSSVQLHDRMHITVWEQVRDLLWSSRVLVLRLIRSTEPGMNATVCHMHMMEWCTYDESTYCSSLQWTYSEYYRNDTNYIE